MPPPGAARDPAPPPAPAMEPEEPGLTPLSRRLLQAAAALSVLLIAVVAYGWRTGDEDANPLSPVFNPIAKAATRTARLPGMRVTMRGSAALTGGSAASISLAGDALYNARTERTRAEISVSSLGQTQQMEMIAAGGRAWVRSPGLSGGLPGGAEWIGVDAAAGDATVGNAGDPRQQLQVLRSASGEVVDLGAANVGGVRTTAYRGDVELDDLASALRAEGDDALADSYEQMADELPRMNVTVWIDGGGSLRRTDVLMPIPAAEDRPSGFAQVTAEYSDFGIRPRIDLPDPSRVYQAPALSPETLGS